MNIEIKYNCENIDWELVVSILERVGMSSTEPGVCKRAFEGSYTTVFAFSDEKLVGIASYNVFVGFSCFLKRHSYTGRIRTAHSCPSCYYII